MKDKFGQQYAGIYVGECEVTEDPESRRNTLTFPNDPNTSCSRRTSQSCLGILQIVVMKSRSLRVLSSYFQ